MLMLCTGDWIVLTDLAWPGAAKYLTRFVVGGKWQWNGQRRPLAARELPYGVVSLPNLRVVGCVGR